MGGYPYTCGHWGEKVKGQGHSMQSKANSDEIKIVNGLLHVTHFTFK